MPSPGLESWRADDSQELVALFHDVLARIAFEDLDLPHVLIRTDPTTYDVTYVGPFDTAVAALAAADTHEGEQRALPPWLRARYRVAPLQPALAQTDSRRA